MNKMLQSTGIIQAKICFTRTWMSSFDSKNVPKMLVIPVYEKCFGAFVVKLKANIPQSLLNDATLTQLYFLGPEK